MRPSLINNSAQHLGAEHYNKGTYDIPGEEWLCNKNCVETNVDRNIDLDGARC